MILLLLKYVDNDSKVSEGLREIEQEMQCILAGQTPAIMSVIVSGQDGHEILSDAFLFQLHGIRSSCRVRETPYCELFNASQRAAIIRFLKFLAFSSRGYKGDDALRKTLSKLPACCKRMRNER